MTNKQKTVSLTAVGVVLTVLYFVVFRSSQEDGSAPKPDSEVSAIAPHHESNPPPNVPPVHMLNALKKVVPNATSIQQGLGPTDPEAAECTQDEACKDPRHADCIRATCMHGKCRYDKSGCECRTAEDCEDNDPCTRNHCFSSTMRCIFIPKDDC